MKTLATLLGILTMTALVAACGPDMKAINEATGRADAAATRAEAAADSAAKAAALAEAAAKKAGQAASGAEKSVQRANDAASRLEAAFAASVTK